MLSCFSHVQLFVTLRTVACQASLSMGFSMDMFTRSDNRKWNGQMASPTQWTWVWANSWGWWRTRKPGVLHSMGSKRVGHDLVTEHIQGDMFPGSWRIPWIEEPGMPQSIQFIQISPYSSPDPLPDPWIEPSSLMSPAFASGFFTTSTTWEALEEVLLAPKLVTFRIHFSQNLWQE